MTMELSTSKRSTIKHLLQTQKQLERALKLSMTLAEAEQVRVAAKDARIGITISNITKSNMVADTEAISDRLMPTLKET